MRKAARQSGRHVWFPLVSLFYRPEGWSSLRRRGWGDGFMAERIGPEGPRLDEAAEDIAGFSLGLLFIRTLADTVARTPRVGRAALAGERERYVRPLRLFFILIGLSLALAAFVGASFVFTLDVIVPRDGLAQTEAFLATQGLSTHAVDESLVRWGSLALWPVMILGSLPFIALLKAFRPSVTWWGHALMYLVANNAMLVFAVVLSVSALANRDLFLIVQLVSMAVFLVALIRLASGVLGLGWLRLIGFTVSLLLVTVIASVIMAVLQFALAHAVLTLEFGVSLFDVMRAGLLQPD
jgi:hypothetical protein